MARTHSTSRKRSAASSSRRKPPEALVFFIDRSFGRKKVPEALRAAGLDIRVHDELFPQASQDVVWLREAGAQRWVVITRDDRIRYNQLEKQAVLAAKLRFFSITSSSLTGEEAAALVLSALDRISRLCRQHSKRGFIAKISRGPAVKISEDLLYRVQSVLSGRVPSTAPRQRAHPDFPLRGFVRCRSCGRGLTGSWSKGRSEYYAYYHCRPRCRAVNVTKARLEGLFADELALLQPTPGYMRLLKESVLQIWKARKAAAREEIANAERAAKAIQEKLDRLDEAFLFERSIDIETYDRHAEKLREELTLVGIERHSGQLEELDVEGILAFAERVLPRAADLWVQASLEQRQRFQQLFFPDGIAFDGKRFVGTRVTAPAFSYLREIQIGNEGLVDLTGVELS